MKVIVVGGGIAGLVAALGLHAAGAEVVVHEAAREIRPVGWASTCCRRRCANSPNSAWARSS